MIFAQKPDRWRIEVLSPMNMPVFLFLSDGKEWISYSIQENRYVRGKTDGNTTLLGLRMRDLVAFVFGQLPDVKTGPEKVTCSSDGDLFLLTVPGEMGASKVWIKPGEDRVVKSEFYDTDGDMTLTTRFTGFKRLGEELFPYGVDIHLPEESTWITLSYETVELNPPLSEDLFQFVPPSGARGGLSPDGPESMVLTP